MTGYDTTVKSTAWKLQGLLWQLDLSSLSFFPPLPQTHFSNSSPKALSLGITIYPGALHDRVVADGGVGNDMPTTHDRLSPADVMMHGDGDVKVQSRAQRWPWCLRVESRSAELPTISDTDWCGHLVEGGHHPATPEQVRRRGRAAWLSASIYDAFAMDAGRASRSGLETADHAAMALYF